MVVDQLPSGEYRMIVGSFEHTDPPPSDTWQITEWRSPDQLNWTYTGPVLTTRDMPTGAQGSIYSPTIVAIAPGLWRMIFTADDRHSDTFRSALWSAVSTDKKNWQLEGEVMGALRTDLYYASLAGNHLYLLRQDEDGLVRLGVATIDQR